MLNLLNFRLNKFPSSPPFFRSFAALFGSRSLLACHLSFLLCKQIHPTLSFIVIFSVLLSFNLPKSGFSVPFAPTCENVHVRNENKKRKQTNARMKKNSAHKSIICFGHFESERAPAIVQCAQQMCADPRKNSNGLVFAC